MTVIQEASPTLAEPDDEELEKRTMLTRNSIALEAQVEERPLAKKQEELDEQEQKEEAQNQISDAPNLDGKGSEAAEVKTDVARQSTPHKHPAKPLLRNDDYELLRVKAVRSVNSPGFAHTNVLHGISVAGSSPPGIL